VGTAPELKIHRSITKALKLFDADRLRWLDEAAAAGPVAALKMGPVKVWIVTDPEVARTMLVTDRASWIRPPATVAPIRIGVGENLFTEPEQAWAVSQPSVAPAFRKKALDERLTAIDAIVDDEVSSLPPGAPIDLDLATGRIALRLAAWVLLGEHLDPSRAEEIAHHQREVVEWVGVQLGRLSGFLPFAFGKGAREMKRHRAVLDAYADEVIARAQASDRAGDDVLGALLAARPGGKRLAPDELRSHVLGLFLAGNETTGAALSWALVHAARAPREWAKVRDDPGRRTLPFLTEALRLTPAVWGIPRTPSRPGLTIKASGNASGNASGTGISTRVRLGQVTTINLRGINRDPNIWTEPLRFDPSRHEIGAKEQHRALLPFGLGPRGCIGQHLAMAEMIAVLPALARRGDFTIDEPATEHAAFALRVRGGLRGSIASVA
jgi:cytochrome P450